jgi:hypothetical protein
VTSSKKPQLKDHDGKSPEYLVAWISQGLEAHRDICIYGNPSGLRRLAGILLRLAEYDQSSDPCPDEDSVHCHVNTGFNTQERRSLPRLTLGRVDSKDGKTPIRYGFPEIDPDAQDSTTAITDPVI